MPAQRVLLDRRVIQWSVILYIALLMPMSLLHEAGHALICSSEGFGYRLWLDGTGGHTLCAGIPADSTAYGAIGGAFGVLASAAIIASWVFKRHPAILAVGLGYAIDQAGKLFLEGFFTGTYASGALDLPLTALQVVSWIGITLYLARRSVAVATARG
jgi:hypothetical protein